jgi:hypothetical protein
MTAIAGRGNAPLGASHEPDPSQTAQERPRTSGSKQVMSHERQRRRERKGTEHVWPQQEEGPDKAFVHAEGCKIKAADPTVSIEWSELERGHWRAECKCGAEDYYEPVGVNRVRLDPLDPKTAHHAPQCEFVGETNPATLKVLLKVSERDDYDWVQCSACDTGWQVPHYAAESVG